MESIAYYEGALGAYEKEVKVIKNFGNGRILQWKQLLRDYKESRKQVETICNETFDKFIDEAFTWFLTFRTQIDLRTIDLAKKRFREAIEELKKER